ncbi:MAG TPA: ABC transporter family substrate-binding protein [Pseudonocardiaceae bacterium]|nr:ABC transporter family substrate-binding protein [Pseudonocardiaceae bacterium]
MTAILVGTAVLLLAGCTSAPPPPLVATPAARTSQVQPTDTSQVVVGVDGVTGPYNPHELADQSAVTTALSSLLLPSVFRTARDGTPALDRTLMVSAQVTNANPFTVVYQVRTDATWSDGTPIDAADFVYLRNQMTAQPGVIDPAGYHLVSRITARDNAKVITVTFAKAYPAWRSLFTDLLPAHLLKDAPGGFASALNDSFPATAGPFDIKTLDLGGGEIVLERSDRYWDRPSVLGQIVLTKADSQGMSDALRSKADQMAYSRVDAAGLNLLRQLGTTYGLSTVARPELASVLLRPGSPQLSEQAVRGAIAAAVDRAALIATGTGGGPSVGLTAGALVTVPSQAGYLASMPAGAPGALPDPAQVPSLLAQAGYVRSGTGWSRAGHQLSLVIAAPAGREPYVSIANQLRAQLVAAGLPATVVTPDATQLYEQLLNPATTNTNGGAGGTNAPIDIVVGPQPAGADPATELASWFGCTASAGATAPPVSAGPLGWCDQDAQPSIDAALTGELRLSDALAKVEPLLWAQAVEIPLFQVSDVLVVGPQVSGVDSGSPMAGPFSGAAEWNRTNG